MNDDGLLKVRCTHCFIAVPVIATNVIFMCQSPIHRDTHFYLQSAANAGKLVLGSVNPLSIGTPISTLTPKID